MTQAWSNCTEAQAPGCVCQLGYFRSQTGLCVPEDHCECWHHGSPHLVRQQLLFLSKDSPSTDRTSFDSLFLVLQRQAGSAFLGLSWSKVEIPPGS
jgi:hypothetical protein